MQVITKSPQNTKKFGFEFAKDITSRNPGEKAMVIALEGELGAGKTTFTQGFAEALNIKGIKSPTFVLMKHYKLKEAGKFKNFYHLDCYRLNEYKDLNAFGFNEILNDSKAIILLEWAERVKGGLPSEIITIHFDHLNKNERKITVK